MTVDVIIVWARRNAWDDYSNPNVIPFYMMADAELVARPAAFTPDHSAELTVVHAKVFWDE